MRSGGKQHTRREKGIENPELSGDPVDDEEELSDL